MHLQYHEIPIKWVGIQQYALGTIQVTVVLYILSYYLKV